MTYPPLVFVIGLCYHESTIKSILWLTKGQVTYL